jgi:hypothetical protein
MLAGFSKPIDNPGAGFALEHQSAAGSVGFRQRLRHVQAIYAEAIQPSMRSKPLFSIINTTM